MLRIRPVVVLFASALTLSAVLNPVIFSDAGTPVDDWGDVTYDAPLGQSFSTGPANYNLTSVEIILSNETEGIAAVKASAKTGSKRAVKAHASGAASKAKVKPALTFTLTPPSCAGPCTSVSLWSDNGEGPGVELAVSSTVVLDTALPFSTNPQQFTFLFSSYPISANTRYWIMSSSPGGDSVAEWWGTDEPSGAVLSEYYIYDGGIYPVTDPSFFNYAQQLEVNGIETSVAPPATPAPSSLPLVLGGLALAGLYLTFRKKLRVSR